MMSLVCLEANYGFDLAGSIHPFCAVLYHVKHCSYEPLSEHQCNWKSVSQLEATEMELTVRIDEW